MSDNKAFGTIDALPGGSTVGTWTIGSLPYVVSTTTVLEDGPFSVGLLVEVHFSVATDRSLNATRIEGKPAVSADDQALAFAYGLIEVIPGPGFIGTWQIGGVSYDATASTQFEQDEGTFATGVCAKIRYQSDNGTNMAAKIETEPPGDCPTANGVPLNRAFGFVDQMPSTGFVGTWVIAGLNYDVSISTQFKEENGVLVSGAYVGMQYTIQGGVKVAQQIETHVPPEAGDINAFGQLQLSSLQRIDLRAADIWQIDGQPYTITTATLLDDSQGDLSNGQQVHVNAFEQNGGFVATKVMALGDSNILFLPIVIR